MPAAQPAETLTDKALIGHRTFAWRVLSRHFGCNQQAVCQCVVQEKLQQAEKDMQAKAQSAQAEADHLHASISCMNAELADQRSKLELAVKLRAYQTELKKQLGEQKKLTEAKEEMLQKINGGKDGQQQEAASMKTRLAEVGRSFICLAFCCLCASGLVAIVSRHS